VKICVVDASVAAKWLLPAAGEGLLDQANRLVALHVRRELQLLAPDLIEAELGNVLWKAVRRKRISQAEWFLCLGMGEVLPLRHILRAILEKELLIATVGRDSGHSH